jgi:hypothetical protein
MGVVNAARSFALADMAEDATGRAARRDGLERLKNALPVALERHLSADRYIVARVRNALTDALRKEVENAHDNCRPGEGDERDDPRRLAAHIRGDIVDRVDVDTIDPDTDDPRELATLIRTSQWRGFR